MAISVTGFFLRGRLALMDFLSPDTLAQASGAATTLLGVLIWRVLVPLGSLAREGVEFLKKAGEFIDEATEDLKKIKEALELPADED